MNEKGFFTTHDVARILAVDSSTVIDWVDRRNLPAYRTPGGHRRIKREDLLAFLKSHRLPGMEVLERKRKTVLVVEDDDDFRRAVAAMIRARGKDVDVHEAGDGFLAGKLVQALKPDAVVLDLRLPGLDGFRVCECIRRDPALEDVRIIAMSGMSADGSREKILAAGADDFLAKPMSMADLWGSLSKLLWRERAAV